MPKTAAELQAEAAAAQREAEEKKAAEARSAQGMWEWFKSLLPDFSFFNILLFAAVACGAYFLGRTETGKKLLGKIFGRDNVDAFFSKGDEMLAGAASAIGINVDVSDALSKMSIEDIRKTLTKKEVPPKVIAVLAKDKPTFDGFISTIKEANGDKVGINDLSIEAIVAGPSLKALLKPENRELTVALMIAAAPPEAGIKPATLNALISRNVAADGTPSAELRRLLTAATDGSLQTLQASVVGADGKFSTSKAIEALLNPQTRALIRSFGTGNIALALRDKAPELSKELLDASLAFGDAIDKNPANGGANRPRTLAVLRAVARMGEGVAPAEALRNVTPEQLSGFFQVPGNQEAVGNLLRVVQPSVARHWGNADKGLAEVLASTPDTANILRAMRGDLGWLETLGSNAADLFNLSMETRLSWAGGKIAENAADLAALMPPANSQPQRRPAARS